MFTPMIEQLAGIFSAAYDKLSQEKWEDLNAEEREFHSGMGIQLQNLIYEVGQALNIQDMSQWYYDCGMRICGSKQYTCESCLNGELL
jgi:hypothetical protein